MRPLRLALEGFTVFRERQEVDFEPLELFVITGPTGAGKTSILDAITFALYGRLPRFAGAQGTSDAVSLGLVRATVELEFSIHNRGRYRIVRRMSRRANQPQTLVFERLDGGTWVPACDGRVRESNKRIAEVVGLDFDAFTRAVLLPQGEFHRFLKGEAGERRRILVSLLGVSYFEAMAGIARRRSAELRARVQRTDELLAEQYADATPEHVEELRAGARAAADQAKAIAQSVENAAAEGTRAAEATTRARAIQAARAQLEALAADLGRLADTAAAAEGEAAATQNRLDAKAAEVDRARAAVSDAQQRERLIEAEVGTLVELARAAAAAQTLSEAAERQEQARLELEAAAEEVAAAQRELSDAQAAHESVSMRLAGASEQAASALAEADSAREGHQQLAAALAAAELAEADLAGAERELVVHAEALQRARAEAERARDALSEATAELEEHRRMHAVAELSSGLSAGDPCPVCGAVLAAAIPVAPDVATALQSARTREEQARAREGAAGQALARAEAELAALEQKRASCAERLSQALAGHADTAALAGAAAAAEAAAAQRAARAAELTGQLEALEREREQLSRRVADAQVRLARCEERRSAAGAALAEVTRRRDEADAVLSARFGGTVPADAAGRIDSDRERLTAAGEAVRAARERSDTVAREHEAIREELEGQRRALASVDRELERNRALIEAAHRQLASPPAQVALEPVSDQAPERAATARALSAWCSGAVHRLAHAQRGAEAQAGAAAKAVLELAMAHGVRESDPERALDLLRGAQQRAIAAAATAGAALEEGERRVAERARMEEAVRGEREQIGLLDALARELQMDRFGEYIIRETLELLSAYASEELLRISSGRYSLTPIDGEFHVIDRANADERRSVRTLSGGETFLASLALALALSRHVGELAGDGIGTRLESVFIDEGFGTLDPATLDEVIDALERLRADDLVVGVISHVPELAQRIQTGLAVQALDGRSRIVAA